MTHATGREAREAAGKCEAAGLVAEADILYRLAVNLELADRASFAASLARVLIAAGRLEDARPFVVDSNDPVPMAILALEAHDLTEARRLLDDARERDPFDPRSASARGRLLFLEKRFKDAVLDLLEAALLRPDGLPDAEDARFLRAARALASDEIPSWQEAVAAANRRLNAQAERRAPDLSWPDRGPGLLRALIARGGETRGVLDRAQRLAELTALAGMGDRALLAAAAGGELRRLAPGAALFKAGDLAAEIYFVVAGSVQLVRETPVGPQSMGEAGTSDFAGEEALAGEARVSDARAEGPLTLLGFTRDFLFESPDRAPWLRHLRACLARRLGRLNDLFREFFPGERPSRDLQRRAPGQTAALSAEEKSRLLTGGGLRESDRILFAAFAQERSYPAESLIFREGDSGDALYAIARGRVRISRHIAGGEEALAILGPGEIFGEMTILDPDSAGRSADARAHEDTLLLELSRSRFEGLERSDPEGCADLSALLCRLAARRCVETAERLARWRILAGPG
ncbi:MAG: cyclic nucleotide-binding domain-containing protein [Thermoanaerobaculia bacterium]